MKFWLILIAVVSLTLGATYLLSENAFFRVLCETGNIVTKSFESLSNDPSKLVTTNAKEC
jgi:hypothetical protein